VVPLGLNPRSSIRISKRGAGVVCPIYIGQFSDASGLSYLNARYYNSAQGQFTSQDPVFLGNPIQQNLQDPQSLNSYSYSDDNPIVREDPSGKQSASQDANQAAVNQQISIMEQAVTKLETTIANFFCWRSKYCHDRS
jgi:RHS repeat-associated protein